MASFKSILKGIWRVAEPIIEIGSFVYPPLRIVDAMTDAMEEKYGDAMPGQAKHEIVAGMAIEAINTSPMTDKQKKEARELVDKLIKATVASRNAARDVLAARKELAEFLDSFKQADDQ